MIALLLSGPQFWEVSMQVAHAATQRVHAELAQPAPTRSFPLDYSARRNDVPPRRTELKIEEKSPRGWGDTLAAHAASILCATLDACDCSAAWGWRSVPDVTLPGDLPARHRMDFGVPALHRAPTKFLRGAGEAVNQPIHRDQVLSGNVGFIHEPL